MEALTIYQHPITQAPGATLAKPERLPIPILIEKFLYEQDVRERSRQAYRSNLKQFFLWVADARLDPFNLERGHIVAYKESLTARGLSPLSVGAYITAVKLFYRFLQRERIAWDVTDSVKPPRKPQGARKQPLTPNEGKILLEHLSAQGPRNKAIGAVMLHCGLRVMEVSRLQVQDLTIKKGGYVLMVHGKGRDVTESVQANKEVVKALKEYLATRPEALPGEPMFISTSNNNKGQAITAISISGIIKEALRAVGLDDRSYTAHSLRHTFGTRLLAAGASLEEVATEMRHRSTSTTKVYTEAIREEIRATKRITELLNEVYK